MMKRQLVNREIATDDPSYYTNKPIQPIEFILANEIPHCEACVIKYVVRWREKGGVDDLRKAQRYIQFLIDHEAQA
jgi:hypothetical protein